MLSLSSFLVQVYNLNLCLIFLSSDLCFSQKSQLVIICLNLLSELFYLSTDFSLFSCNFHFFCLNYRLIFLVLICFLSLRRRSFLILCFFFLFCFSSSLFLLLFLLFLFLLSKKFQFFLFLSLSLFLLFLKKFLVFLAFIAWLSLIF